MGSRLYRIAIIFLPLVLAAVSPGKKTLASPPMPMAHAESEAKTSITVFFTGDVMLGRGIDQILPHPNSNNDPDLQKKPKYYVWRAKKANGPVNYPVDFSYVWGDALKVWDTIQSDVRLINLETSITKNNELWPDKAIHYRMHPDNIKVLQKAGIDYCSLANNHVLDFNYKGLRETLSVLSDAGIHYSGAGLNLKEASKPAVIDIAGKGRVIVFSMGTPDCGIPVEWAASDNKAGVNLLEGKISAASELLQSQVEAVKKPGDIVIAAIHWGKNYSFEVAPGHRKFAHELIDIAGVDIIWGHSSHHVKPIEVYKDKLIIYGAGDFLNDYEGLIKQHDIYRSGLGLMYFAAIDRSTGKLSALHMIPTVIRNLKVNLASRDEALWLWEILHMKSRQFGSQIMIQDDNSFMLRW